MSTPCAAKPCANGTMPALFDTLIRARICAPEQEAISNRSVAYGSKQAVCWPRRAAVCSARTSPWFSTSNASHGAAYVGVDYSMLCAGWTETLFVELTQFTLAR